MKTLKVINIVLLVLSLLGILQSVQLYVDTFLYNPREIKWLLPLFGLLFFLCSLGSVSLDNKIMNNQAENSIYRLLKLCPSWMMSLYDGTVIIGLIHFIFSVVMISFALKVSPSNVELCRWRAAVGNSTIGYICSAILFYAIVAGRRAK